MKLDLNPQFKQALSLMEETSQSLFITGKAGTGKSTLLDYFCNKTKKKPAILATTGVSALNVKGQTIHRFFNFYIDVTPEKIRNKDTRPRDPKLYRKLKTIIIDEASMLRADLLDCIDVFLRMYGPDATQPFGGLQMIFVGDLYQLPPVVKTEERDIFRTYYETPYFFSAKALESASLEVVELETVYRQKEEQFIGLLNKIRNNLVEPEDIEELNQRHLPNAETLQEEAFTINLTATNAKADEINKSHLNALGGKLYSSEAIVHGDFGKEYYPTATNLQFKVGSQIMLLNNDEEKRWVNGSIGIIEAVKHNGKDLRIRLHDGDKLVSLLPFTWDIYKLAVKSDAIISECVGGFTQYPFRLAWAVTIHKSQGKTFDRVVIDIGQGPFNSGQIYVALSRCTSFEGIKLKAPIKKQYIRTDPRIYKFLASHAYKKAVYTKRDEERMFNVAHIFDKKICTELVKTLMAMCVRSAEIRTLHASERMVTKTGDYSDVKVVDAEGNEFAWPDISHISDDEMKVLMKGLVDHLYTFMMQGDDPRFDKNMDYHKRFTRTWDDPEIDPNLDRTRKKSESRGE